MRTSLVFAALAAAGCGGGSTDDSIKITSITPAFAPLAGGTQVVISGQGFLRDGAPPNQVVFGDNEAPLAAASDDGTLVVETPPAAMAGDVPVIVFNRNGQQTAMGMFHYSAAPTITSANPTEVPYNTSTTVTLTGTGFQAENAGVNEVLIDGQRALDVTVVSDTQLTFTALPGQPLAEPDVQVVNTRGAVDKQPAFRYVFSNNPTLVLFTKNNTSVYMVLYDPTADMSLDVPSVNPTSTVATGYRAVVVDANGKFFAIANRTQNDNSYGQIDFTTQTLIQPIVLNGRINGLARSGANAFAVDRNTTSFGTFDIPSGTYTEVSNNGAFPCCSSGNLASNVSTTYWLNSSGIAAVNTTAGTHGAQVALNPAHGQVDEMHFAGSTLYAIDTLGNLFTINPTNGATVNIKQFGSTRFSGFEVFTPGGAL